MMGIWGQPKANVLGPLDPNKPPGISPGKRKTEGKDGGSANKKPKDAKSLEVAEMIRKGTRITKETDSFGVVTLYLSESAIPRGRLPIGINNIASLTRLFLRKCGLTSLGEDIGKLAMLEELDVSDNQVR